jgi:hypothetical protein
VETTAMKGGGCGLKKSEGWLSLELVKVAVHFTMSGLFWSWELGWDLAHAVALALGVLHGLGREGYHNT